MKQIGFIFLILAIAIVSKAQPGGCTLKLPQITINFGAGYVSDPNTATLSGYRRVYSSCPTDGHYSFASYTRACFSDDWHSLMTDHTPGDADGNMLLVNAAPHGGAFLNLPVNGLKSNTIYELGLWLMNLCKPTKKCPSVLLPSLNIRLETPEGKIVANIVTRDLPRIPQPRWYHHTVYFTTPASTSALRLVMTNHAPGGCGNDFALDDITFRECVKQPAPPPPGTTVATKQSTASKPSPKKVVTPPRKKEDAAQMIKPKTDSVSKSALITKQPQKIFPSPPPVLKTRENALVRKIETEAGEIKIEVYDNGEIDGDTVSIYHNNTLIKSYMRLSQKPITFSIVVNPSQPHHEIIMVAENLGSIPPNTSVMIITTPARRYEVLISSTEQKNAKVVFDLKK